MSRINWVATGNFTSEWRPLTLCLLLWVLSTWYFFDPSRIDIAAMYKRNFAERPQPICSVLNNWGVWESAKFTARYVLPVVPSVGFDELDAGDDLDPLDVSRCRRANSRFRKHRRLVPALDHREPGSHRLVALTFTRDRYRLREDVAHAPRPRLTPDLLHLDLDAPIGHAIAVVLERDQALTRFSVFRPGRELRFSTRSNQSALPISNSVTLRPLSQCSTWFPLTTIRAPNSTGRPASPPREAPGRAHRATRPMSAAIARQREPASSRTCISGAE